MNYLEWKTYYDKIAADLQISQHQDKTAAEIFDRLIQRYSKNYIRINQLEKLMAEKTVYVFGASPDLEQDIYHQKGKFESGVVIAADGATTAFLKYDIIPDIIVTDLDGVITDQLEANNRNAILIIHAHADNIAAIQHTIPKITGSYFGTIQTNPTSYQFVQNFGGFTDGDRAIFIADHFHAKQILLGGFDCDAEPGFYSFQKNKNIARKRKKLKWCHLLLQQFSNDYVKKV